MGANDRQVGGDHYRRQKIQPWDVAEAWGTKEEFCGFLRFNALKYLARYRDKGGVEDLKKARHYLDKLIETLEQPQAVEPERAEPSCPCSRKILNSPYGRSQK